ncbi:hypothetical protein BHE74_00025993 [Ensete ventricosum]|uniref:Uncharacterized protein n=1 Tax=Ensete ventricosum TaxID=4639 RepID=A0A426Z4P7_ENSVE|nr:hypothetical protein B296_00009789 [Ensete ventricosum]RWW66630.1 hypothetical protein BHE74_00025993 [Ensete ventricosum]
MWVLCPASKWFQLPVGICSGKSPSSKQKALSLLDIYLLYVWRKKHQLFDKMSLIPSAPGWLADNFIGSLVQKLAEFTVQFGVKDGLQDDLIKLKDFPAQNSVRHQQSRESVDQR